MYKAPEHHDESLMPIPMGSHYRVPDYTHPNWGITYTDESAAVAAYEAEWAEGTSAQLGLVSQASIGAGFGNYPQLLRQSAAREVAELCLTNTNQHINFLDIGAGPGLSALAVYEAFPEQLKNKLSVMLIEPSAEALETAQSLMIKNNIISIPLHGSDLAMLGQIKSDTVDVLIAVASAHHHARIPFEEYARVLKKRAFAVFADWHHDIWEHPTRVSRFLERFDWPKKEAGLANWKQVYPQALENPDKNLQLTPEELMAREQITRFWLAYKNIADKANLGPNAIWPLEGHRPVARYIEGLQKAGFVVNSPKQLLPDSTLLMVTVAQKLKKCL